MLFAQRMLSSTLAWVLCRASRNWTWPRGVLLGAHAGSVSYGPALNAAAVVLTSYGNVPPERAARVVDMLLGVPVSAGWVDKAGARLSRQLEQAGFDAAMCAALAAEPVLAADETPVNVLAPGAPRRAQDKKSRTPKTGTGGLPERRTCWSSGPRTSG